MLEIFYDTRHRYPERSSDSSAVKQCYGCDADVPKPEYGWKFGGWDTGKEASFYSIWICPLCGHQMQIESINFNLVVQARVSR